jgi:hypothetical protein
MKPVHLFTHTAILLAYTLLACAITWPLLAHISTHLPALPNEHGQDVWQNAWNLWWVRTALLIEQTNPYQTTMILYPAGASLYLHTLNLPLGLLALPLLPLLGIIKTYNLLTLLVLVLVGYTTFLLAHHLVNHTPAAFVAGSIVLCSPQRITELRSAQLPTISDYAIPLVLLTLLLAFKHRTWRTAFLVAATLLLAGLSSWYHLFHAAIMLGVMLLWHLGAAKHPFSPRTLLVNLYDLWERRRLACPREQGQGDESRHGNEETSLCPIPPTPDPRPLTPDPRPQTPDPRPLTPQIIRIALASLLLLLPFILPVILEAATAAYAQKSDDLLLTASLSALLPNPVQEMQTFLQPVWWRTAVFATLPVLLALLGLLLAPRRVALWATIALVCLILSLGPTLIIGTQDTGLPLPYALLRQIPLIKTFRAPERLNAITTLMLALLAAHGLAHLARRVPAWTTWLATPLLGLLILAAVLQLPFPLVEARPNPLYPRMADEAGEWSVLEYPFSRPDRLLLEMYTQTFHHKYILTGQTSRYVPRMVYESVPPLAQIEQASTQPDIVTLSAPAQEQLLQALRVRSILFHRDPQQPQRADRQAQVAQQVLPGNLTRVYSDTHLHAYRLDHIADWLDGAGKTTRTPVPLFLGLNLDWAAAEQSPHGISRWLPADGGGLWTYTQQPRRVVLAITLYSLPGERPLELWCNDQPIQTLTIPAGLTPRRYLSKPFMLPAGQSLLELRAPQGGVSPHALGLGDDKRPLSFSIQHVELREVERE